MPLTRIKTSGLTANVVYQSIVAGTGITVTANSATQVVISSSGGGGGNNARTTGYSLVFGG
jgi:hypothetical protein